MKLININKLIYRYQFIDINLSILIYQYQFIDINLSILIYRYRYINTINNKKYIEKKVIM